MIDALTFLGVLTISALVLACCVYLTAVLYRVASAWWGEASDD